jgi:hypothetical protein
MLAVRRLFLCLGSLAVSSVAVAQSSEDPADLYAGIRISVRETIEDETRFSNLSRDPGDPYDLVTCLDAEQLGLRSDDPLYFPVSIALDAEIYRRDFSKLAIPEAIWANALSAIDQVGVAVLQDRRTLPLKQWQRAAQRREAELDAARNRLLTDLNAYRKSKPDLPEFTSEGGCGAREVEVTITTTPRGGTVSYIPVFSYKLCEARKINPEDLTHCDGWLRASKVAKTLAGKYRFIAIWPDGRQKKGILDITGKKSINISQ